MSNFAKVIKKLMEQRGVSSAQVCKATSIPKSTLSEWLSGREPKFNDSVIALARFFGVSVEHLLTGEEPEEEIVRDLLESADDGFVTIHKGVYRLRVEKYTGAKKKE